MSLRALVVDDERIARQRLKRLLEEAKVEVAGECGKGADVAPCVEKLHPDVIFLDIQMPGLDGFDVIASLPPAPDPAIVFVTAFEEHAVRAFDACALDYLLKPVAPERLARSLSRVQEHLQRVRSNKTAAETKPPTDAQRRFSVRSGLLTSFVAPEEIDWIEADGNYAILHVGPQNHFLRETMSSLETKLPAERFFRVSRSAIVRLDRVKQIEAAGAHHCVVLQDGARVPLTRSVRDMEAKLRSV